MPPPAKPPKRTMPDSPHYAIGGIEVIDVLRAKLTPEQFEGHCRACAIKYLFRYDHKNAPVSDLIKSRNYIDWLIESIQRRGGDAKKNN